jgi:L-ascorbate metabolism protein UlaG (beta-lactamase superfamily)
MIIPLQQDGVFLADLDRAGESAPESLHVWWLGQSGFLVQWGQNRLLLDPYLSDSLTRKYATTDKPHVRMTERVVDPSRLSGIGLVTATHAHTDHLDPETLVPLVASNPGLRLVFPEAIRSLAGARSGLPPESLIGLDAPSLGRTVGPGSISEVTVGPFRVQAVPAAHEALDSDPQGRLSCLGFVIRVGSWTLYHSGDTVLFPGLTDCLREARVDLGFLPINGRSPERRVAGNLWGHEAATLAHQAGIGAVVPCHYELFEFNTASPADFEARCQALQQPYHRLQAGGRLTLGPRSRP